MRYLVLILLIACAHFALTPFAPAAKAWIGWPFAADSKSWLGFAGGLPQSGGGLTAVLAGLAGLGFLAAALGLFWNGIPANWWAPLVIASTAASALLFMLYINVWAILPLALDAAVLWGVLVQHWTSAGLRGG